VQSLSRRKLFSLLGIPLLAGLGGIGCRQKDSLPDSPGSSSAIDNGLEWLLKQQSLDGAFRSVTYGLLKGGESLTAAVLIALLDIEPHTVINLRPALERGLSFLADSADAQGAVGFSGSHPDYPVYATALSIQAAARVRDEHNLGAFEASLTWLKEQQLTSEKGWSDSPALGGWPMGSQSTPSPPYPGHVDLSMTRRALEALTIGGRPLDGRARTDALAFVSRAQMSDGGFLYSPVTPGLNKAGRDKGYGSATCDGLLALHALGDAVNEDRMSKGLKFLRAIHRTDRNPGLEGSPMSAFAPAMKGYYRAASSAVYKRFGWSTGQAEVMSSVVRSEQRTDGSWKSNEVLQKEDDPLISTAFALQTLAATQPTRLGRRGETPP
jgi:hypothetical protein